MASPLSPAIMLATSMHAQPGTYAVLLGSGASRGAGLPTGWDIVTTLVGKVAAQMSTDEADHVTVAAKDPEAWWLEQFGTALGYSSLLGELAPTPATRQGILEGFFERPSSDEDADAETIEPSKAHHAIAQLVKRGTVRVVVTTNFDRLMEQALSAAGVEPQVVSRPDAVAGMRPLAHAPATVIKLHGDYKDVESLNTAEELSSYPEAWRMLLAQVFDEYGLVISGWSAQWDTALVNAITSAPSRRYPLYWDARSSKGPKAAQLLRARQGHTLPGSDADETFAALLDNVVTLDRLAEPQLSTALAVARLKRWLPDPLHRIDLYDLVMSAIPPIEKAVANTPTYQAFASPELGQETVDRLTQATTPLLHLLAHGGFHDDGTHDALWIEVVQRLMDARGLPANTFDDPSWGLHHYSAVAAFYVLGVAATAKRRDAFFIKLAETPTWKVPFLNQTQPAARVLHPGRIFENRLLNDLPWRTSQNQNPYRYPASHFLRDMLRPALAEVVRPSALESLFDDMEYRQAVLQWLRPNESKERWPYVGEYLLPSRWRNDAPDAEVRLQALLDSASQGSSAWQNRIGTRGGIDDTSPLVGLREELGVLIRF